ncbi:MAG: dipeptide ABC transporter ATP-binding protein [Spirochaetes bacterium]|nr:dipeptide ABC transporter ATP-binding protein [Spirochaetota bacterium]
MDGKLLQVKDLKMHFPIKGGVFYKQINTVKAVDGVSFDVNRAETLGLVGESGCGKTTVGRAVLQLYKPSHGEVYFNNRNISEMHKAELRGTRRDMQIIFQDPFESLNSRHTVGAIIEEPFIIHKIGTPDERKKEVIRLLDRVGLTENALNRYPHEFSGGQRQRIGIARAIALNPKLIICDEPVSALDVSIQSQVLNLLIELQQEMDLTYIFISHDLTVVKHISDRIAVMYLGKIVEFTNADSIYQNPMHPYTQALISAIPRPDPLQKKNRIVLTGDVPSPVNPPSGCSFHTRCPYAEEICKNETPLLNSYTDADNNTHQVSCHFAGKFQYFVD